MHQSVSAYLAQCNASVQSVHEVIHVYPQLWVQCVHPLGQVFAHRVQVLLAGLEWPVRPRFQQYSIHGDVMCWVRCSFLPSFRKWVFYRMADYFLSKIISPIFEGGLLPRTLHFTGHSRRGMVSLVRARFYVLLGVIMGIQFKSGMRNGEGDMLLLQML